MIKCAFASLGCAKNLVDTENMMGYIKDNGMSIVSDETKADVIIVNTCAFIEDAAQESCDRILELSKLRESGSAKCLIVTGCLPERYGKSLMEEIPEIDAILGTGEFGRIAEVIGKALTGERDGYFCAPGFLAHAKSPRVVSTPKHYAYLKVADGCVNRCAYCLIPKLRGEYRSRLEDEILDEALRLSKNGMREALVIAQDTTRYGEDIHGSLMLPKLLKDISKIDEIDWIRLMYAYPTKVTDELIEVMATNDKILKYVDLPMQHGSDEILKSMNRPMDQKMLIDIVDKLRSRMPGMILRTTFIVGFPGEKERHIEELLEFIDAIKPERAGVFTYSREEGTPAYDYPDQVTKKEKKIRQQIVMEKLMEISREFGASRVGSEVDAYVEGVSSESELVVEARSYAEAPDVDGRIYIGDATLKAGDKVRVRITESNDYDLAAEVI